MGRAAKWEEARAGKLRVFVADDHMVVREGLKSLVSAQPDVLVVGEAAGGCYIDPTLTANLVSSFFNQETDAGRAPAGGLSERKSQVLRLVAWGDSNKEIGWKLGVSVKSVDTYKLRLMEKLDLRSRTDIVRYALRHGLLQEE